MNIVVVFEDQSTKQRLDGKPYPLPVHSKCRACAAIERVSVRIAPFG